MLSPRPAWRAPREAQLAWRGRLGATVQVTVAQLGSEHSYCVLCAFALTLRTIRPAGTIPNLSKTYLCKFISERESAAAKPAGPSGCFN